MKPSAEEIAGRIEAIAPILAANAPACVEARRVVPESMKAMVEAGLFRICQPARVGGYELGLRVQSETITALSQICPSSGWIVMVMGAHHFCLASWPEPAQEEIFGGGRDGLVSGTLAWQGKARAVEGGYRVDGRWQFCSGVDNSNWVILGCGDAEGGGPGVHVVVPREEIVVDDTWHVLGMEGTGSKDVVAKDLFVPAYRAIDTRQLMTGSSPHTLNHQSPVYRVSADSMLSSSVPAAVLGSARFALEKFIERTKERRVIVTGARRAEHGPTQLRLAESMAEIQCAELLLRDAIDLMGEVARSGHRATDMGYRARVKWQAAYSAELCRRAVARLFSGSGAHAIYDSAPLQAAFRNVNVGAQHASIDFDTSGELYGRMRLGLLSSQQS
jgi:3-hydroxy-9,10-secoandrosta-1,3,5(10)-triene-9,17-dione monooxygenase